MDGSSAATRAALSTYLILLEFRLVGHLHERRTRGDKRLEGRLEVPLLGHYAADLLADGTTELLDLHTHVRRDDGGEAQARERRAEDRTDARGFSRAKGR